MVLIMPFVTICRDVAGTLTELGFSSPSGAGALGSADAAGYDRVMDGYFGSYVLVAALFAIGVAIVAGALTVNRLLRPTRPTPDKLTTYECGVDPVGEGWAQSQVRYYVFTYLYVVFAVDAVFLFPWATIFDAPGYGLTTLAEMFVFLGFIALGIVYAWRKRVLTWT
jgi:NADH-quinone oxidoreductase subunit A